MGRGFEALLSLGLDNVSGYWIEWYRHILVAD